MKKKDNRYNKMCDRFEKLDKHLEDMHQRLKEIKESCETAEIETEEIDPLLDFGDLFSPDLPGGKK
tara:strand:+ start:258 stop:455 length:198 start_codon:yes stop_codon:yes gene_type:complete